MEKRLNILVFGCGQAGIEAFHVLHDKCNVVGFLDNNSNLWKKRFFNKKINDPSTYSYSNIDAVVIASMYYAEIELQLDILEVPESKVFASYRLFLNKFGHKVGKSFSLMDYAVMRFLDGIVRLFYAKYL